MRLFCFLKELITLGWLFLMLQGKWAQNDGISGSSLATAGTLNYVRFYVRLRADIVRLSKGC